jgi:hypothetical protein
VDRHQLDSVDPRSPGDGHRQHVLGANTSGEVVDSIDLFPGHYTMDTMSSGHTVGMLSVNATTGAVWYHTWHGRFVAKEDA